MDYGLRVTLQNDERMISSFLTSVLIQKHAVM